MFLSWRQYPPRPICKTNTLRNLNHEMRLEEVRLIYLDNIEYVEYI